MRLDLELRLMSLPHRSTVLRRHKPRLNNRFLSTMNWRITERILSIENRSPLDSDPSGKSHKLVNDSLVCRKSKSRKDLGLLMSNLELMADYIQGKGRWGKQVPVPDNRGCWALHSHQLTCAVRSQTERPFWAQKGGCEVMAKTFFMVGSYILCIWGGELKPFTPQGENPSKSSLHRS